MLELIAGLVCGIISGLGIGGGSLLMLYMTQLAHLSQKTAQGINLLYFLPTALASLFLHIKNRFVAWKTVIPAAISGALCAVGSGLLASSLADGILKKLFGGFLLVVGCLELFGKHEKSEE